MTSVRQNIDYDICDSDEEQIYQSISINKFNQSVDSVKSVKSVKEKIERKINNYFYPDQNILKSRFQGEMTNNDLFKTFGTPYIICLKDTAEFKSYFYNQILTESQHNELINSIDIIPTTYKPITALALKYLTTISSDIFNKFIVCDKYGRKIESSKDVLLCCLLRFKYTNIIRYLKQFDGISTFIDLYNSILINEYLGQQNKTSTVRQNHIQIISNMSESNYYTIHNNCQLNITLKFKSRGFNLALSERLSDKTVQNVLKHLAESKEEDNNYLAFLFRKSAYLDAASAINISGYKLYKISNTPLIDAMTKDNFNTLYDKLSLNEKYHLIMNCIISKDLCHFIINNKYILNEIFGSKKDINGLTFMNKYGQLIRYYFGYAWLTMYMEESIKKGYITSNDRFIFDIETASKLPYFPYSITDLHSCPYLPLLIETSILSAEKNIMSVQHIKFNYNTPNIEEQTRYGVCSKETFTKRLNMFISGLEGCDLLQNMDWSNIAMSGSMMACCLPNFNSLMANFIDQPYKTNDHIHFNFIDYANEYYREADIDVMCNITDIYSFVDKIYDFKSVLETNIKKIHKLQSEINITNLFSNKSAAIMINKDFIKTQLVGKIQMDYIDILSNLNDEKVKKIIYEHYIKWHKEYLKNAVKENPINFINNRYHDIYDLVPVENINVIFIKTQKDKDDDQNEDSNEKNRERERESQQIEHNLNNDINIEEDDKDYELEKKFDEDENIDPVEEQPKDNIIFVPKINFKFRISSSYLPHNFEFFQIKHTEFFSTVARFHLPIVRSYYDGNNIYITPSCISACTTLLNIDYKYFAGSKDPIEIINKYRMRGFGTILNDREIVRLLEYSNLVPKWKSLYGLNVQYNTSIMKILGILDIGSTFFKPSEILDKKDKNNRQENYKRLNYVFVQQNSSVVYDYVRTNYLTSNINDVYNMSNLTTINKFGYVEPIKKWLIDAFYDFKFNKCLNNNSGIN
jgi:hypothetical protein